MAPRRKVFVSYHHDNDGSYYQDFARLFDTYHEVVTDNSVERRIDSDDSEYVMRRIRENYLTGSSVTIVLCGPYTWGRKYVDWEILASLNQRMGLIGLNLPTNPLTSDNTYSVPGRLHDNIQSGYAGWLQWSTTFANPQVLLTEIEASLARSKSLIDNSRARRARNGSI
jgi:hypothetical protein